MTQVSYEPGYGSGGSAGTSVMAVFSLIFGILALLLSCVVIGGAILAPIGLLLGLLALVLKGQKSGGGLAVGGIVTSLIAIVVSAAVGFGAAGVANQFGGLADVVAEAQRADVPAVRARLSTAASNDLTDEAITRWGRELTTALGDSSGAPDGFVGLVRGYFVLTNLPNAQNWMNQQNAGGNADPIAPIPVSFSQGDTVMFVRMNQNATGSSGMPLLDDAGVVLADDQAILWLRAGRVSITQPAMPPPTTAPATPTDPDADANSGNG